ncbi:hypothetical protein [Haliovirga abyssi]|uniref:Uncharacterized protein n=1 Tax=Haliovirga abyssi TaxID=2996794 RepID=A0AAU9DS49_9FUSO|nr:hypothetical protein [Haliovirga abyssi]BDU51433.1 hypothetical protein HLVA_20020 [Haliovirga abyssi]
MKKTIILLMCIISAMIYANYDKDMYVVTKINGKEVIFPQKTATYIETMLNSDSVDSYLKLFEVYNKLGYKELSLKFLKEYTKKGKPTLELAEKLFQAGEYKDEIEILNNLMKDMPLWKQLKLKSYIYNLIENEGLDIDKTSYKVSNIDYLFSLLDYEKDFYDYYKENRWSDNEKIIIKNRLKIVDMKGKKQLQEIFFELSNKFEKLSFYYNNIEAVSDKEGFFQYFSKAKELGIEISFHNIIEKIYYLKYTGKTDEYQKEIDKTLNYYIKTKNYEGMYELYTITKQFKIIYNLALENDFYFYKLIFENINSDDFDKLTKEFEEKYPDSKFMTNILKMKLMKADTNKKRLELINKILEKEFTRNLFEKKIDILKKLDVEKAKQELENFIINKSEEEEFIYEYEKISNDNKEVYDFLDKLDNKKYIIEYCEEKNIETAKEYSDDAIKYFMDKKEYGKLLKYKGNLTYEEYYKLINLGKEEFKESAAKKYPFELKFSDINNFKYIYFNDNFINYNIDDIEKIENKENKTDAEYFYLAEYYDYIGDTKRAFKNINHIYKKYKSYTKIIGLYNKIKSEEGNVE